MFTVLPITDFADPRLAPFRNMRVQIDHLNEGVFVAEGEKVVRRLVESSLEIVSVLLPPKWQPEYEALLAARAEQVNLFVAPKEVLEKLTGFALYQGVLGVGRVPRVTSMDGLLALPGPRLFVALDGLSGAENAGAVVRNAMAFGSQALIVGEMSSHPYLRRAVRGSMGTVFKLPYFLSTDLPDTLRQLRAGGVRCVAAHPHTDQATLWDLDLTGDLCLVLGSEGNGIRPEVLAACNAAAVIPMHAGVDSLNVAAASAVCFAEVQRQRNHHS